MVDIRLAPESAFKGCDLPFAAGGVMLVERPHALMVTVAAYAGAMLDTSLICRDVTGLNLPEAGRWSASAAWEIAYSELDAWCLWGPQEGLAELAEALEPHAAVTDQSSGFAGLRIAGDSAAAVLARLTPIDLRPNAFPNGHAARTEIAHMSGLILARDEGYDIWVARSFARTLHHDLTEAMKSVGALAADRL